MGEYEDDRKALEAFEHLDHEKAIVAKAGKPVVFREGTKDEYTVYPDGERVYRWNVPFEKNIEHYRTYPFSTTTTEDALKLLDASGYRSATARELEYFLDHVPGGSTSPSNSPLLALGDLDKGSRRYAHLWNPYLKPRGAVQKIDLGILIVLWWKCNLLAVIK